MGRKSKRADGDVVTVDGFTLRGHLTVEEFNDFAEREGEPPTAAVRHFYARCIPAQPGDEYAYYVHDWGDKPARGAMPVTERCEVRGGG